jgi:hypothetical protein
MAKIHNVLKKHGFKAKTDISGPAFQTVHHGGVDPYERQVHRSGTVYQHPSGAKVSHTAINGVHTYRAWTKDGVGIGGEFGGRHKTIKSLDSSLSDHFQSSGSSKRGRRSGQDDSILGTHGHPAGGHIGHGR